MLLERQAVKQTMNLAIDWEQLHQISDQNEAFERELLQIFAEDTQQHLNIAKIALKSEDAIALSRAAHHIKGASANVGLYEMKSVASMLEAQALKDDLTQASTLMMQLFTMLETLRKFLES